ncbi:MAG: hypothetical protein AAF519_12505, partial [Bacteroidota bacterium]
EAVLLTLGKKLLGFDIKNPRPLTEKLQITIEREPDFLKQVTLDNDSEIILHLEFQRNDEYDMVYRMAEYKAIVQRKYKIPVRQYVIYLGTDTPQMPTKLPKEEQITGFNLTNIHDIPVNQVLDSDIPEEIVLSILTEYPKTDAEQVISRIIHKLREVASSDAEFKRSIQQLVTLSRIRKLEKEIEKQIEAMPITYNIETDYLYNRGIERGIEQEKATVIKKALIKKKLTVAEIADLADVSIDFVLSIQSELK